MRWILVGLAIVAATMVTIALSWPWWSVGPSFGIGPGAEIDRIGGSTTFRQAAVGVSAGALVTVVALLALAGALAAKRKGTLAAGAVLTASATALVAGVVFVATFPTLAGATIARGMIAYFGALAIAVTCAVIAGRAARDRDRRRDRPL